MIRNNLSVEDARILFRNFSGKETKFNRAGNRNFYIIFDQEDGERLLEDGWNLGKLNPRDEYDEVNYKMAVAVSYGKISPKIYMIKGKKKILLTEETVGCLDYAEIETTDIIVRPYNWEVNGKTGVKAYVHTMYVIVREDKFDSKYSYLDEEADMREELPF